MEVGAMSRRFSEFWPYYLSQHRNPVCRGLHYLGIALAAVLAAAAIVTKNVLLLFIAPVVGYFCSWVGHFVFEKNRPATFRFPFQSLRGDFTMFFYWATGRLRAELRAEEDQRNRFL